MISRKKMGISFVIFVVLALAVMLRFTAQTDIPAGFALANGRIEATEFDIATKRAERLKEVLVREGDMVRAGQVLARMDTATLDAALHQAQAQLNQSREARNHAVAIVAQRESELSYAEKELRRSRQLVREGHVSKEKLDRDITARASADAALTAAGIKVVEAEAAIEAAAASVERIQTEIADSVLTTPIDGRVLYRLSEPGEVLPAGGKVLTVLDLTDVYMSIFLPAAEATRIAIGAEARIILDAVPQYHIPATVSFVAPRAQFTPKQVETRSEREKLMFRVKVALAPALLQQYIERVKTGVPGVAYVRLDRTVPWPEQLQVALPPP